MSGILVLAGSDVSMSDLDEGLSARIDLNLNLAPPWSPDFLGLGSGSVEELRGDDNQTGHHSSTRRILPRFGPGIHGVFLDLQQDLESQPDQSAFAQVRGVSPFSSSPSHEQVMPPVFPVQTELPQPNPPVAAPEFSQETVEQHREGFYEQADVENGFLLDQDGPESGLFRHQLRHGFRRYTRPPAATTTQIERVEVIPSRLHDSAALNFESAIHLQSPFTCLVDAVKELEVKEDSSSGERQGEASSSVANFECNVCLDMAVDPVLTSCGHLFCWPCLYRWLFIHSEDEECPVCKGAVTGSDIVPIYGRGCKTACSRQSTLEDLEVIPPRPHARRRESLRQRYGSWVHGWDVDRIGEVERDDPRTILLRSNEVMRVRRAFQFLQENIQGTMHTRVRTRRRMADRRERFRAPTAEATFAGASLHHTMGGIHELFQRGVAHLSEYTQDGMAGSLTTNGAPQVADRLASLRARVSNRAASTNSYRSVLATISGSGPDGIAIPSLSSNPSPSHTLHGSSSFSVPEEASSAQRIDIRRETNDHERPRAFTTHTNEAQSSRSSGYADVGAESSRCRKRRRLN